MSQSTAPNWVVFIHLSLLSSWFVPIPFLGIIAPLLIWQLGKARYPHFEQHGRNAMNWAISVTIYSVLLPLTVVGLVLLPVLVGLGLVFPVVAAVQASKGRVWQYPLALNILGTEAENLLRRAAIALLSLAVLPFVMLAGSAYWLNSRSSWLTTLSPSQGMVTRVLEQPSEDGDALYQPVIEFQDDSGETYRLSSLWWSSRPTHEKGESVAVLYSPTDPNRALVNRWIEKWLPMTLAIAISAIFLLFSLIPSLVCILLSRT
ncbi:MAG: DUF4870 domain-containing protein [Elainellaceae cyanobacterium]